MKRFIIISAVMMLSGCAAIDKVKEIWPRDHDSALVSGFVNLQVSLEKADCSNKETILDAKKHADWLNRYAEFRNDPQRISTKGILDNLDKAIDGSEAVCKRWINLSKTRMDIIKGSWSGR
jgi:hypothetical protein